MNAARWLRLFGITAQTVTAVRGIVSQLGAFNSVSPTLAWTTGLTYFGFGAVPMIQGIGAYAYADGSQMDNLDRLQFFVPLIAGGLAVPGVPTAIVRLPSTIARFGSSLVRALAQEARGPVRLYANPFQPFWNALMKAMRGEEGLASGETPVFRPRLERAREAEPSISGYRQFEQGIEESAIGSNGQPMQAGQMWIDGQLRPGGELVIQWAENIGDVGQFARQGGVHAAKGTFLICFQKQ